MVIRLPGAKSSPGNSFEDDLRIPTGVPQVDALKNRILSLLSDAVEIGAGPDEPAKQAAVVRLPSAAGMGAARLGHDDERMMYANGETNLDPRRRQMFKALPPSYTEKGYAPAPFGSKGWMIRTDADPVPEEGVQVASLGEPGPRFRTSLGGVKLDPALQDIIETAAERFPGYTVHLASGVGPRGTGTENHPKGRGIDVWIEDEAGNRIPNYKGKAQTVEQFAKSPYGQFAALARQVQQEKYPELDKQFRAGGFFQGGPNPGDDMHFDTSGGLSKDTPVQTREWKQLAALVPAAEPQVAAADDGRPVMYGVRGLDKVTGNKRGEIDAAMRDYAEKQGFRYEPINVPGENRARQTSELAARLKANPGSGVIAYSAGVYAVRDGVKSGAIPAGAIGKGMFIGAPGTEGQIQGIQDVTYVPEIKGVDHLDLVQTVAAREPAPTIADALAPEEGATGNPRLPSAMARDAERAQEAQMIADAGGTKPTLTVSDRNATPPLSYANERDRVFAENFADKSWSDLPPEAQAALTEKLGASAERQYEAARATVTQAGGPTRGVETAALSPAGEAAPVPRLRPAEAAPMGAAGVQLSDKDLDIGARIMAGEAANQGVEGRQAVAEVLLNRAAAGYNGKKTVADVALDGNGAQFNAARGGGNKPYRNPGAQYEENKQILRELAAGQRQRLLPEGTDSFHGKGKGEKGGQVIGAHVFYSTGGAPRLTTAAAGTRAPVAAQAPVNAGLPGGHPPVLGKVKPGGEPDEWTAFLQQKLKDAMPNVYGDLEVDGLYGPDTEAAVKSFSRHTNDPKPNGRAGPHVWGKLAEMSPQEGFGPFPRLRPAVGEPMAPPAQPDAEALSLSKTMLGNPPRGGKGDREERFQPGNPTNQGPFHSDAVPKAPMQDPTMADKGKPRLPSAEGFGQEPWMAGAAGILPLGSETAGMGALAGQMDRAPQITPRRSPDLLTSLADQVQGGVPNRGAKGDRGPDAPGWTTPLDFLPGSGFFKRAMTEAMPTYKDVPPSLKYLGGDLDPLDQIKPALNPQPPPPAPAPAPEPARSQRPLMGAGGGLKVLQQLLMGAGVVSPETAGLPAPPGQGPRIPASAVSAGGASSAYGSEPESARLRDMAFGSGAVMTQPGAVFSTETPSDADAGNDQSRSLTSASQTSATSDNRTPSGDQYTNNPNSIEQAISALQQAIDSMATIPQASGFPG